jgi:hypothetical protein
MLVSLCSCAPWCLLVDMFSICRVIALDLVKICNFHLVLPAAQEVFGQELSYFTEMLVSMCSCAPWFLLAFIFF